MARGGKREGAGRKKGSATIKTRAVADAAAAAGITPLEVLLDVMRRHHAAAEYAQAVTIAVAAAPYVHPRLSATTVKGTGEGGEIPIGIRFVNSPPRADGPDAPDA